MNDETMTFSVFDEDGNEIECEVLFIFESEETGKNYIVYTDNTQDDDGSTKVFASTYDPNMNEMALGPIETDKEWAIIETILTELQAESSVDLNRVKQYVEDMYRITNSLRNGEVAASEFPNAMRELRKIIINTLDYIRENPLEGEPRKSVKDLIRIFSWAYVKYENIENDPLASDAFVKLYVEFEEALKKLVSEGFLDL